MFLFPQVYKPEKINFAGQFRLLSGSCDGHIFTLCGESHSNLPISTFRLHARPIDSGAVGRVFNKVWISIVLPLYLLWGRTRVDAILAWDPYASGLAGSLLKLFFRSKLIVLVPGDYHTLEPSSELEFKGNKLRPSGSALKKLVMRLAFRLSIRAADAIVVINTSLEKFFRREYPAKAVYRFPDFTATDYFESLEVYQGDYLLSVGHPFHRKGVDVLIRAFRLIADRHPAVRLRIMGYASEEELKSYRAIADDDPRIEFLKPGWIEDVGEQMKGCYALVNAARSEAQGRVHFEAMAARKPVVATRTSGGVDYIRDGETGLLCEIDDVQDLARKLDEVLSDRERAARMGEAGFARLRKEFSEARYEASFLAMLSDVLNQADRMEAASAPPAHQRGALAGPK